MSDGLPGSEGDKGGPRGLTGVRQAERPEPQVGRSVGDTAQAVLDGVDCLVHEDFGEVQVLQGGREHRTSARGTDTPIPPPKPAWMPLTLASGLCPPLSTSSLVALTEFPASCPSSSGSCSPVDTGCTGTALAVRPLHDPHGAPHGPQPYHPRGALPAPLVQRRPQEQDGHRRQRQHHQHHLHRHLRHRDSILGPTRSENSPTPDTHSPSWGGE